MVCTLDTFTVDKTFGPGVLTIVGGKRFVGVDEPNATTVDLTCITRLTFVEFINAENSETKLKIPEEHTKIADFLHITG